MSLGLVAEKLLQMLDNGEKEPSQVVYPGQRHDRRIAYALRIASAGLDEDQDFGQMYEGVQRLHAILVRELVAFGDGLLLFVDSNRISLPFLDGGGGL